MLQLSTHTMTLSATKHMQYQRQTDRQTDGRTIRQYDDNSRTEYDRLKLYLQDKMWEHSVFTKLRQCFYKKMSYLCCVCGVMLRYLLYHWSIFTACHGVSIACYAERRTSYSKSIRLSVCL